MKIKGKNLSIKDIRKKINWQLSDNFFNIQEAIDMPTRKLIKILKYICNIQKIDVSRKDLKELALFIKSDFKHGVDAAKKVWDFVKEMADILLLNSSPERKIEHQFFIPSYQTGKFELMLN